MKRNILLSANIFRSTRRSSRGAFTLIELATVLVIICVLATMLLAISGNMQDRAKRVHCMSNLKNLFAGAAAHLQEHGMWPQIATTDIHGAEFANAWIDALAPYGITRETWICPTYQRHIGNPDYHSRESARTDYLATPFDARQMTPYRLTGQPWFVERAGMHGDGNLMIFPDGSVISLGEFRRSKRRTLPES
jgi:prepilin-type N-terminal cleavage/methylation domain-containing protein